MSAQGNASERENKTTKRRGERNKLDPHELKIRKLDLTRKTAVCPLCGNPEAKRHSVDTRTLHELGTEGPTALRVRYSKHHCTKCNFHFSVNMEHLAKPYARFTSRVRRTSVDLVVRYGYTLEHASKRMRNKYYVRIPPTTLHDWVTSELQTRELRVAVKH